MSATHRTRRLARAAGFDVNAGEERAEVFLRQAVERGLFGPVPLVLGRI